MRTNTARALRALILIVPFALVACGPKATVDANAMNGVMQPVLDRHDFYVTNDSSLTDVERDAALRSSALMRGMVDTALGN